MRFFLAFFFTMSMLPNVQSHNQKILSGRITDQDKAPITQALVAIEGTTVGTYSDNDGYYQLAIPEGRNTYTVSAFGYDILKRAIEVKSNTKQNFILQKQSVNLHEVEVYGATKAQQLREGSFSVNALDVKTYANTLTNLNDLIGRSSGVNIREEGGVGSDFDLSINGLSGNSVRYFIDGVPLSSVGNGITLANLPINLVDRVEVYKGVVPAELGIDALGGAINIITKQSIKNYADLSYGIGSFNTHKTDFNAQYVDTKTGIFFRPSFGLNYSKNNYMMKGVKVPTADRESYEYINTRRFHDDYLSLLGQFSVGVANKKWTDLLLVTASYSYVDKDIQTGSAKDKVIGMATRENKAFSLSGQYKKRNFLVEGLAADLSVSRTWDYTIVTDTAFRKYAWDGSYIYSPSSEIRRREHSIEHVDRPLTIFRANFDYALHEQHIINVNYLLDHISNNRSDDYDKEFVPSKDTFGKSVIGLSYKQSFWNDRLSNTFFSKTYLSRLKIGQTDLAWVTGTRDMPKSSSDTNWGYGLSTRFRLTEWLAIKASAEHSVRLPLPREFMGNGGELYPNFRLKPEHSNNYNLGLFGFVKLAPSHTLFYETGAFHRGVKDYIKRGTDASDGTAQYVNLANVRVNGLEGELRYEYNNSLQVIANLSYVDQVNNTKYSKGKPDAAYKNRIPNKPWIYGNAEINFKKKNIFGDKLSQLKLSYSLQYVHWFYLAYKDHSTTESNITLPSQYIQTVSATYSLKDEKYNISLECNNLFDELAFDNYAMQKPGRSFFCKLRMFIN